jgi:hypothetical protein
MNNIKARSTVESASPLEDESRSKGLVPPGGTHAWDKPMAGGAGEVQSTKLKSMLAGLKKAD